MIDNLKTLKDDYLTKGGEDPEFINKINDLEGFLSHKRPMPNTKEPYRPGHPPTTNEIHVSSNA